MAGLISYDYIRKKALADPDSGEAIVYLQDIAEAPTVDAVEVVRCRECKNMIPQSHTRYCTVWNAVNGMGDDGFCNYGERKDDGSDG